ncbi:pre-mRNA-splicing factor syf2 [Coelomomyces lativittatus]|nr:pre-mRNA-splicing factor syf2 [Coelomomyces lativittatus]KAJ1506452.1 pre-mRNA-splicing factor syf2 [Coelomomyces lativittatus]
MIRQLQPDLSHYETQKQLAIMQNQTDAFYGKNSSSSSSSSVIVQPNKDDVDRLVKDLKHQVDIRNKSSRRRAYNADEDVTYINDKNRNFNKKISRAFDKYTKEIKDSLERGTAL